jgi:hypothetical protein
MDNGPLVICIIIAVIIVFGRRTIAAQLKQGKALSAIDGFAPAVKYEGLAGSLGVAIDPQTNRFAVAGLGVEPRVFDFSELIAVDAERDGASVTTAKGSNGLAGAAIGVALLGPAGVLLGSGTRSRGFTSPTVTKLSMKIYVSDLIHPCHEIVFYRNSRGGSTNSGLVSNAATRLDEWYGRFRTILAMQAEGRGSRPEEAALLDAAPAPVLGDGRSV